MSRILELKSENVKRLVAVTITPEGHMVVVGGDNGAGKSSVLDSIAMALGGKDAACSKPVRAGEEKACIVLKLDDLTIRRTFTAAGGTSLVVENSEGARFGSPQAILDKLTGTLTFDPLAFCRLKPREQGAQLQKLVGLDFTKLDTDRARLFAERTIANREVERVKTLAESRPSYPDAPAEPVSIKDLVAELDAADASNRKVVDLTRAVEQAALAVDRTKERRAECLTRIEDVTRELAELRKKLTDHDRVVSDAVEKLTAATSAKSGAKVIDVTHIRARLDEAESVNAKVNANVIRRDSFDVFKTKRDAAEKLTAAIEAIDAQKAKEQAGAKYPIEGLRFTGDGVEFNGLPFEQASSSDQIRIAVAIAAALNPKLRVMLVRDGSLLGAKSLSLLGELAKQHDLQVWVERVSEGAECSVIIEDGHVAETKA